MQRWTRNRISGFGISRSIFFQDVEISIPKIERISEFPVLLEINFSLKMIPEIGNGLRKILSLKKSRIPSIIKILSISRKIWK